MKCPKCQAENSETKKFCGECGTQLTQAEPVQSPASPADDISMPWAEFIKHRIKRSMKKLL